jgi:hypothetical protein
MLDCSPDCRALSQNGSRREFRAPTRGGVVSIAFRPVLGFATGNTFEIMGVVARLATTETPARRKVFG